MNALRTDLEQYLSIFESELQYMAGDAHSWGDIGTGGVLYGLWSHALRPVIMLATPAGPGAIREKAHFAVDPDYVIWMSESLQDRYGIQYDGNYHSHHRLDLDHPSPGDTEQIHGLAGRH
ncbi:MAG: hypothetical protein FJ280_11575 [Planctomycetes bacterium]|nr:hypothetical protein [Planctomycetota bacterium]